MVKKVIEAKDDASIYGMQDYFKDDTYRIMESIDYKGYSIVFQKYDIEIKPSEMVPSDAKVIEEIEYIVPADMLDVTADSVFIQAHVGLEDDDWFLLYDLNVSDNPEIALDDIDMLEVDRHCFKSVDIEEGLRSYIEELIEKSEDDK